MLSALQSVNLGLRFALELGVLGATGYWGYQATRPVAGKLSLAIGVPLLIATIWAIFGAPKASVALPTPVHVALEVAVFGAGVVALALSGQRTLAVGLAAALVLNRLLMLAWGQ